MVSGLIPKLHGLTLEIKYTFGFRYLDRCGQTFLDIERSCDGWYFNGANVNEGTAHNPKLDALVSFNMQRFAVTSRRTFEQNIGELASNIVKLWQIVKANLGLDEITRVGCRLDYLLPTPTIDGAEKITTDKMFSSGLMTKFMPDGYKLKARQLTEVVTSGDQEYRIAIQAVTRTESINPGNLFGIDPRRMHEKQKKYRIELMKKLETYSQNPMFALQMDIDCVLWNPKDLLVDKYVVDQVDFCNQKYLPTLQQLGASI